jgi:hypothetical protein
VCMAAEGIREAISRDLGWPLLWGIY